MPDKRYYIPNSAPKVEGQQIVSLTPAQILVKTPYPVGTGLIPDKAKQFDEDDVLFITEYKIQDGKFQCLAAKRIRSLVKYEVQAVGKIEVAEDGAVAWTFPGFVSVSEFATAGKKINKSKQVIVAGPLNNLQ